jgi:hypothetical protein
LQRVFGVRPEAERKPCLNTFMEGFAMDAITISAKFAAYTWYVECARGKDASREEAAHFANENWRHFLNHANTGLGRLLSRIARPRRTRPARRRIAAAS